MSMWLKSLDCRSSDAGTVLEEYALEAYKSIFLLYNYSLSYVDKSHKMHIITKNNKTKTA